MSIEVIAPSNLDGIAKVTLIITVGCALIELRVFKDDKTGGFIANGIDDVSVDPISGMIYIPKSSLQKYHYAKTLFDPDKVKELYHAQMDASLMEKAKKRGTERFLADNHDGLNEYVEKEFQALKRQKQ